MTLRQIWNPSPASLAIIEGIIEDARAEPFGLTEGEAVERARIALEGAVRFPAYRLRLARIALNYLTYHDEAWIK